MIFLLRLARLDPRVHRARPRPLPPDADLRQELRADDLHLRGVREEVPPLLLRQGRDQPHGTRHGQDGDRQATQGW